MKVFEAATIRMRARGAARALRDLLKEKELPEGMREQVEGLYQAMGKTWGQLAGELAGELAAQEEHETTNDTKDTKVEEGALLSEARSVGVWFEGMIHQMFTDMADEWYRSGWLSREERIVLSGGIGSALEAFVGRINEVMPDLYVRLPYTSPEEEASFGGVRSRDVGTDVVPEEETVLTAAEGINHEGGMELRDHENHEPMGEEEILERAEDGFSLGDAVELVERAVRGDGTMQVKLIQAGWGSSGYYPQEVLERDGPQVFRKGLKMFWNHPTVEEERARPEGDLRNLAAELVGDARWDGSGQAGAGLYAEAKVFGGYKEAVEELAPHIGVSIRASGKGAKGSAEGREGLVLNAITGARSVDFVTMPGAGGQVVSLFESKRMPESTREKELSMEEREELERLRESVKRMEEEAMRRTLGEMASVCVQTIEKPLPEAARSKVVRDLVEGFRRGEYGEVVVGNQVDEVKLKEVIQGLAEEEWKYVEAVSGARVLAEAGAGRSGIVGMGSSSGKVGVGGGKGKDGMEDLKEVFMGLGMDEKLAESAARGRG